MEFMKRRLAWLLIAVLVLQLVPAGIMVQALQTADLTDSAFNGEGLWITEIYNNDVDRSATNDSRAADGYQTVTTYASASDLMEFIEVCNTHDADIKVNDLYEIYLDGTLMTLTDMSGSADITLTRGQIAVLWNYRTDIVIPTEAEFRDALDIPDTAMVLKLYYGSNWGADSGTFTIKNKQTGETVSTFTAVRDTHTKDGLGVHLQMPVFKGSDMEVYRALDLPTAGRVRVAQVNGLIQAQTASDFDGKGIYITEVRPNDVDRSSTYGTTKDVMECLEVTNTSDTDIYLNTDVTLSYVVKEGYRKPLTVYKYSSSASDHVGSSTSCVIPAGSSVILWCYRYSQLTDYTSFPTLTKFRDAYGISSDTKVYIFTGQGGLTNDLRGMELYTTDANGDLDTCLSRYFWHNDTDCPDGTSAHLKIDPEGPEMILYSGGTASNLGTVAADQLTFVVDNGGAMELRLYDGCTVPTSIMQGQDLRVYFYFKANGLSRTNSAAYYRLDGTGDWLPVTEGGIRVPNRYEVVISGANLFDSEYVEFYVEQSNAYRTTRKGIFKVGIDKLNDVDGVRTNIADGEVVKGTVAVTANDGGTNSATEIYIDGTKQTTTPMLEDGGYFCFTADGIDNYFRSAITTKQNELIHHIGKWAYLSLADQIRHIDSSYFTYSSGEYKVVFRIWAGTLGTTATETVCPDANRDDFTVTHLKMKLPNGKEYLPSKIGPSTYQGVDTSAKTNTSTAYDAVHSIGDSTNWCPYMNVTFTIPDTDVDAVGVSLDTTTLSDGKHTLKVVSGTSTKEVTFIVDNSAPTVDLGIASGATLTGNITLAPEITDANGINESAVTLDGEPIQTPCTITAYDLGEGEHTLATYVKDAAGNETSKEVTFLVDDVVMSVTDAGTKDITHSTAQMYLTAQSDAATSVTFYRAEKIDTAQVQTNTVDGLVPYIQYTIDVSTATAGDEVRVDWDGTASGADDAHASRMFVQNAATGAWELIGEADSNGTIQDATFLVDGHVTDGKATVIVQCTAETALPDLDTVNDGVTGNNDSWDGTTIPEDYDFSFAWISDTQIYVQRYQNQFIKMNNWIVDSAAALKIKYVIHTGDIVDDWDAMYQWENADTAMKIFDDAGMPYGVLGGNHDVASGYADTETYLKYFGEDRVKDQPTFGGSYKNNLGHYDLVSENGQDFIIVYMSWNIYQEEIDWMNEVLAKYADRKAILCFHGYTHVRESVDGLLDYWGVMVRDQVVAKNPNVFAVLNGHYSGATYQTVRFDDNGNGTLDRTVYQICTDYQSLDKGGLQYVKFLYFDLDNDKVFINSYSPSQDDFNYYDGAAHDLKALAKADADGVVSSTTDIDSLILTVNFSVDAQTILENSFSAELLTDEVLGTATLGSATGSAQVEVTGLEAETGYRWYAVLENENTGYLKTASYEFTTEAAPVHEYVAVVTEP
ncbi:MAG: metallophosphoesterase, partial [Oscillospiraceae bacterium]|nr:metallophosphoesterase [Oscillospiraceae bacterium]